VIADRIECQKDHDIELAFHFSEKCHVYQVERTSFEISNDNKRLRLHLDARLQPTLYHGSINPICGWISRTFGVKEPTSTIVARTRIAGLMQFHTEIVAHSAAPISLRS
jgi:hypothetical protein